MNCNSDWSGCKNILCIRADNMGDVMMSSPAFRALKQTFKCRITVLTSRMGKAITPFIPEIDEVITYNLPWIQKQSNENEQDLPALIEKIREKNFDGAVIFTVYSQNPLPSAMLAYMAGIRKRLAYCRENPYELLTDWVIENEPVNFIQHQVQRDLAMVETIGATTDDDRLSLDVPADALQSLWQKLHACGLREEEWIIFHPGVSEKKRQFPSGDWIELGKLVTERLNKKVLITGAASEIHLAKAIKNAIGPGAISVAGMLSIAEFISLVKQAPLVVSVNTSTVHIAAATGTPVIVLYALTNPQHTPWKVHSKVFPFPVDDALKSKNAIIDYVNRHFFGKSVPFPKPQDIFAAVSDYLQKGTREMQIDVPRIISL